MIEMAKLRALSLETLQALGESVKQAVKEKQRSELRIGSLVEFFSVKRGRMIQLSIQSFGPKNLQGYEIDKDGNQLMNLKWRVNPSMVKIVRPVAAVARLPVGVGADRPANASAMF